MIPVGRQKYRKVLKLFYFYISFLQPKLAKSTNEWPPIWVKNQNMKMTWFLGFQLPEKKNQFNESHQILKFGSCR
jgi:hypothetical protein